MVISDCASGYLCRVLHVFQGHFLGKYGAMKEKTIEQYAKAIAATNWAGVKRLAARNGLSQAQHLDHLLTATALLWAESKEPIRSTEYKALIEVLQLLDDDRIADAQQFRHEKED